jgi:uncharacterized membrane protein YfhO
MTVEVPAGNHSIDILYNPLSFQIGWGLSICGILIVIVFWFLARRKENLRVD